MRHACAATLRGRIIYAAALTLLRLLLSSLPDLTTMGPSVADPEGEDFVADYVKRRKRWLLIGMAGVAVGGLIPSAVGILWNERE